MDRSGPGGPRGPQPPLVDQECSGLLGIPRMPTQKAHAQTLAYQSVKKQSIKKIHLGLA